MEANTDYSEVARQFIDGQTEPHESGWRYTFFTIDPSRDDLVFVEQWRSESAEGVNRTTQESMKIETWLLGIAFKLEIETNEQEAIFVANAIRTQVLNRARHNLELLKNQN